MSIDIVILIAKAALVAVELGMLAYHAIKK